MKKIVFEIQGLDKLRMLVVILDQLSEEIALEQMAMKLILLLNMMCHNMTYQKKWKNKKTFYKI